MEQLKSDFESVASRLEIDMSMQYLKKKQFEEAVDVLKAFEVSTVLLVGQYSVASRAVQCG